MPLRPGADAQHPGPGRPSPEAAEAALSALTDSGAILQRRRNAVAVCCELGLLQGLSGGSFSGEASLNRAQACAVWERLNALLNRPEEAPPLFGLRGTKPPSR